MHSKSITYIDMDYVYFDMYKIDITDDFDGLGTGGINLYFKFYYERMFEGGYYDRLYNDDGQYLDSDVAWQYSDSFSFDDTGEKILSDTTAPSYCHRMTYAGWELKLDIKVAEYDDEEEEWVEEIHSIELGYLWNYNTYYWTAEIDFYDTFDGAMKLYIKIVW
ncbi:MAG TPA: hypothetical protein VMZ29_15245 [Candidatus Bathyarchaeia archaeon]|nr:hypothetical protein [Candidatus Bathyarchaeia archaeon]